MRSFLSITLVLCAAACSPTKKEGRNATILNQEFATPCEAFEALGRIAVARHVSLDSEDFSRIRQKTGKQLATMFQKDAPSASTDQCADIEEVGKAAGLSGYPLYRKASAAFVSLLDPHSYYLTTEEMQIEERRNKNERRDIGISFRLRLVDYYRAIPNLIVEQVFPGSSAEGALQAGDKILEIENEPTQGKSLKQILYLLSKNDTVTLKVDRTSAPITVAKNNFKYLPIYRQTLRVDGVALGYFKVRNFLEGSADLFGKYLKESEAEGIHQGYMIDLRGNPGGFVIEAVKLVDHLIDQGIVVYERGNPKSEIFISETLPASNAGQLTEKPIVVLIDQFSASAAEIAAGTLLHSSRGLGVGTRSFGKGTGQDPIPVSEKSGLGGELDLTTFRYFLFDDSTPQGKGEQPHMPIPDLALDQALTTLAAQGKKPKLTEDEKLNIITSAGARPQAPSANLASLIRTIQTRKDQEEYQNVCTSLPPDNDDCQKAMAAVYLKTAVELQPRWPQANLVYRFHEQIAPAQLARTSASSASSK